MSIKLSILIVNYNGRRYLQDCFNSIYTKCASINFEIIVVDNNSTDESVLFIEENYPEINLIKSSENLGFAKGNNLASKHANGDFLLLLNNDTILLDNIEPAISILKNDTTIGAVGIKMLDENKKYLPSVGKFPKALQLIKFSFLENKRTDFISGSFSKKQYKVDWVTGAFLLTSKVIYEKVNGLDEDYFMYVEDVDFCKKVTNLGKKIVFLPNLSYIHFVGFNPKRELRLINGYKMYASKHFSFFSNKVSQVMLFLNSFYKKKIKKYRI